eukprot:7698352-Pyramimonas_sp.AAC.1
MLNINDFTFLAWWSNAARTTPAAASNDRLVSRMSFFVVPRNLPKATSNKKCGVHERFWRPPAVA